jgi:hemoglobin-like flavoprotein
MERAKTVFADSLRRSVAAGLVERFYEIFLAASTEVAEKFANTDFAKQRQALRSSLFLLMLADVEGSPGQALLARLADSHGSKGLDIRPELYEIWLDSLCLAVEDTDPAYDDEVEQAWRGVMQPGIDTMVAGRRDELAGV